MKSTMNPGLKLSKEYEVRIRQVFQDHLGDNKQMMNFEDFKKCFDKKAFKNDFLLKRIFEIFDKEKAGEIHLTAFIETVQQFAKDENAKILFLFKLYDNEDTKGSSHRGKPVRSASDHDVGERDEDRGVRIEASGQRALP